MCEVVNVSGTVTSHVRHRSLAHGINVTLRYVTITLRYVISIIIILFFNYYYYLLNKIK